MKKRSWVSWSMALLLVLSLLSPIGTVYADSGDKTSVLTNVSVTVKQNGAEITGTTLPNANNLSIEVSFGVPVAGDYPTEDPLISPVVQKGDYADISLGIGLTLSAVSGGLPISLTLSGGTEIGHVTAFNTDSTSKNVTAHVVFDGDYMSDPDISGINAGFKANLQVNSDGGQDESGNTIFTILNKTYTIVLPPVPTAYTVAKSGTVDLANKCINWTVDVTATQGSTNRPLDGYIFSDDLTNVGAYVSDSFTVGGSAPNPSAAYNETSKILTYTFPDGSTSPQQIIFKTAISDTNYYAGSQQTISNTAKLMNGATELAHGMGSVSFTPQWISKTGQSSDRDAGGNLKTGHYDPMSRTVTWTITANQNAASLGGVYITDLLPNGLTLNSATWQKWDSASTGWGAVEHTWTEAPADGKYVIGDISTQILLTIVTNVPNDVHGNGTYTTAQKAYGNSAKIFWTGGPGSGIGTGTVNVTVGYNAISKSGSQDTNYRTNRTIHWSVTVDPKGQSIPDLKVYDLLVYGSSINLSTVTGIPNGIAVSDLTPQYNQKYAAGFSGSGLTINSIPLTQDGVTVADLLEITGLSGTDSSTFTFDTQVVNPAIYAGNTSPTVYNTATLFSVNAKLNRADASVSYPSNMLAKEMLQRGAAPTTVSGANTKTSAAANGFDYVDKSVIFRLSVNANGMDLTGMTNAAGQALGNITLTDTLPEGWVFDKIDGKDFLIFAGSVGSNSSVTVAGSALTDTGFVTADFSGTTSDGKQKTATFTFSTLTQPYVILVKAKPTGDTAAGYFSKTQLTTVTNSLNLKAENWTPGISTTQNVTIDSTILSKNFDSTQAASQAYLTWTVEYKPYELDGKGTRIEDTLPAGIDLRTDSGGKLALTDKDGNPANIFINKLTLQTNGSYALGDPVTPVLGTNVSYDNASRVLTFNILDPMKAYRFTYVTDITGNSGGITNQVKLYGSTASLENTQRSYSIVEQSGWATLTRGGSLTITKTDGSATALSGAEFTLYASDGTTVIRKGTTAGNGTLKMRAIPAGSYTLRETKIPGGYLSENVSATPADHTVTVTVNGSVVTTSIDGKTGADSNTLTVKNYQAGTAGNLTIGKTVAGNAADQKKQFTFTLNLTGTADTYYYIGNGVPDGTIKSGDTVSLAHGQSITIMGLPKDAAYTVTEENYSADGYSTVSTVTAATTVGANSTASGAVVTGTIVADDTQTAVFTNTRNVFTPSKGNLTISKTVAGIDADTAKKFNFTVTFSVASASYHYTGNGVPDGTIKSGDTISLAHGQSITIADLPADMTYQVSEEKASAQGYSVESAGSSGTISASQDCTAAFTNTKLPISTGSLTISKTVTGQGASLTRKFKFTVILTGAPDAYPYSGSASGTLRSGDKVSLSSGESITITGLPADTQYIVTEADYTKFGYTSTSTGAVGTISADTLQTASFINSHGNAPGTPTDNIDDEDTPQGSMDDDDPPQGYVDGEDDDIPQTGDNQAGGLAKLGLLFSFIALMGLTVAEPALRKKHARQRKQK